jgi:hypothetical protein
MNIDHLRLQETETIQEVREMKTDLHRLLTGMKRDPEDQVMLIVLHLHQEI